MIERYDDEEPRPIFPIHEGHAFWCGTIDQPLDCDSPIHEWALGTVVTHTGPASLVLSQPDNQPVLTIVNDDGPVFALALDEITMFSEHANRADQIAHGHWPQYYVA